MTDARSWDAALEAATLALLDIDTTPHHGDEPTGHEVLGWAVEALHALIRDPGWFRQEWRVVREEEPSLPLPSTFAFRHEARALVKHFGGRIQTRLVSHWEDADA